MIEVVTPGGSATSATEFKVKPKVAGFTPASGPVGASVSITGSAFTGATAVAFNGTAADTSRPPRLDPSQPLGWLYLGLANQRTGRASEARSAFQRGLGSAGQAVIRLPRSGMWRATLAYFCAQLGQAERASLEARQAMQLAAGNDDVVWLAALTYERLGNREHVE